MGKTIISVFRFIVEFFFFISLFFVHGFTFLLFIILWKCNERLDERWMVETLLFAFSSSSFSSRTPWIKAFCLKRVYFTSKLSTWAKKRMNCTVEFAFVLFCFVLIRFVLLCFALLCFALCGFFLILQWMKKKSVCIYNSFAKSIGSCSHSTNILDVLFFLHFFCLQKN